MDAFRCVEKPCRHSCCVRNQVWDVRTLEQWLILSLSMGMASGDAFCSLLTFIPLVWPPLSPFEHSLHLPAAAGVAELRMQGCPLCCSHPSSCQACLGQLQLQGRGWGWGCKWMWGKSGFQSPCFGWVLGGSPATGSPGLFHCVFHW